MSENRFVTSGVETGCVLAMILSWDRNHSILYALLHGIFSWGYVLFYAVTR